MDEGVDCLTMNECLAATARRAGCRGTARRRPTGERRDATGHRRPGARRGQAAHQERRHGATAPDTAVTALFNQAGVIRTDTLGELLEAARVLTDQPLPAGHRLAIVGNAGGLNVLAADAADAAALTVPARVGRLTNPADLGAEAIARRAAVRQVAAVAGGMRLNAFSSSWALCRRMMAYRP
jgi:hypothetical protein